MNFNTGLCKGIRMHKYFRIHNPENEFSTVYKVRLFEMISANIFFKKEILLWHVNDPVLHFVMFSFV